MDGGKRGSCTVHVRNQAQNEGMKGCVKMETSDTNLKKKGKILEDDTNEKYFLQVFLQ